MMNQSKIHKNMESEAFFGQTTQKRMNILPDKENQRSENGNKLCDDYEKRESQKEKENIVKRTEYRDFLLKQMSDKEKLKEVINDFSSTTLFSEELLDASAKFTMKLQKQKEAKENLDACIKVKQDMKLKSQRCELEEEQKRTDFWKKHDDDNYDILQKAKQHSDRKEVTKNEVALLWTVEKNKDCHRDHFIHSLNSNEHQSELIETQNSIRLKKELYQKNQEKIAIWLKNLELIKNEQEKLKLDIEKEEELERKLNTVKNDEADGMKKILKERNYQCANNKFFGID